jgi:hypothetical protein
MRMNPEPGERCAATQPPIPTHTRKRRREPIGAEPMRPDHSAPVPTPIRWWRLPWSRNHLMRRSDRHEAALVPATAVLVLLLILIAAAFRNRNPLPTRTPSPGAARQRAAGARRPARGHPPHPRHRRRLAPPNSAQNTGRTRWATPEGRPKARAPEVTVESVDRPVIGDRRPGGAESFGGRAAIRCRSPGSSRREHPS